HNIRPNLPPELVRVITRCLRKDPMRRAQSMADLKVSFEDIREDVAAGRVASAAVVVDPTAAPKKRWFWVAAIAAVLVVTAVTWTISHRTLAPAETNQSLQPTPLTSYPGDEYGPTLSPDGSQVAFNWTGDQQNNIDIYVKIVGSGTPLRITTDERPDVFPK